MKPYICNDYCMNLLLSNSCANPSEIEGYDEMEIELHCVRYIVTCKLAPGFEPKYREETNDFEVYPFPYEISDIRRNFKRYRVAAAHSLLGSHTGIAAATRCTAQSRANRVRAKGKQK